MYTYICRATGTIYNQGKLFPLKEYSEFFQEWPHKEFKIIILQMLRELQEKRETITQYQENNKRTKWEAQQEIKTQKEPKILELKNTMT